MKTEMFNSRKIKLALCSAVFMAIPLASAVDYEYDPDYAFSSSDTITVVIRSNPGGGYDTWGRLVASHLGKHLPGNPRLQPENRPGAGGLVSMNYIFNNAPSDGTAILMATREFAVAERLGESGVNYRTLDYGMLGSTTSESRIWLTAPDSPVSHLNDILDFDGTFIFAAGGVGDGAYQMADLLAHVGYPTRVVTGYEGTGAQLLSILRGETDGFAAAYPSQRQLIEDEDLQIIAKLGAHLQGEVDDIRDIFTEPDHVALANVMAGPLVASRPFLTHPNVPAGRLDILQKGFRAMMDDPEFIADAERNGYEVIYTSPEEMYELYEQTLNAPDSVMDIVSQ